MQALENIKKIMAQDKAAASLGIILLEAQKSRVVLSLSVTQSMTNGYDLCHGGVIFSLADTALAFACIAHGETAVTQAAQIDYINSAKLHDELRAVSEIVHHRKRNIVCDVKVTNQHDELIAIVRGKQIVINA